MKTKHTQGKWIINKYNNIVDESGKSIRVTGLTLAGYNDEEVSANTQLIASAPDMLEALIMVKNWAEEFGMADKCYTQVLKAIDRATYL